MDSKLLNELVTLSNELKKVRNGINEQLMIEGVDDPGILKCIFLAGGPGSGKTKTADVIFSIKNDKGEGFGVKFAPSGLKVINSDVAFEAQLKKSGINPKDLARIEKEEPELWDKITKDPNGEREKGKIITKKTKEFYEAGRLGIVIDGTGDDYAKVKKQKDYAESLGYDAFMVFVNTSLEVAQFRNSNRDSRVLPADLVTSIWKECQNNLGKFQSLFSGKFRIVDNTNDGNNVRPSMLKQIDKFMAIPVYNPIGKKWIQQARALKNANIIK